MTLDVIIIAARFIFVWETRFINIEKVDISLILRLNRSKFLLMIPSKWYFFIIYEFCSKKHLKLKTKNLPVISINVIEIDGSLAGNAQSLSEHGKHGGADLPRLFQHEPDNRLFTGGRRFAAHVFVIVERMVDDDLILVIKNKF